MKQPEAIIFALAQVSGKELKHQVTEVQRIRFELKDAEKGRHVIVDYDPSLTYQSLSDKLFSNQGPEATILHYSGHSSYKGLWVTTLNRDELIDSKRLSTLVKAHGKFRLAFLNSCDSYEIAQELIRVGVPYVICTTDLVEDGKAALVAAEFYKFLGHPDQTVEVAFQLTADYLVQHFPDAGTPKDDTRTFQIEGERKTGYVWKLEKHPELTDEQKNWVLVKVTDHKRIGRMRKILIKITIVLTLLIACSAIIYHFTPTSSQLDGPKSIPTDKKIDNSREAATTHERESHPPTTPVKNKKIDSSDKIVTTPERESSSPTTPTIESIAIKGNVKDDATGEPLDSVHVIINGVKTVTENGRFAVRLPVNAPEKNQEINIEYSFRKDGYQFRTQTETIFIDSLTTSHRTNTRLTKLN